MEVPYSLFSTTVHACVLIRLTVQYTFIARWCNNMQPQSSTPVRWSLKVSTETDVDLRTYLAQHGMRKGDLSKFVEQAVRRDILLRTMNDVAAQNATASPAEIEADIAVALRESRSERLTAALARQA